MKMRQGLTMAALCTVTGASYAQSSVTLYGVADVGIEYLSNAPSATGGKDLFRMSSGNMSTSRWGIRGVEDLGGGMKAIFQLESGIAFDTGSLNNTNKLFDRNAFVGLSSRYGTVTLGRQTTPMYDTAIQLDPMAFAPRYSLYKSDDIIAGRADNAVKYQYTGNGLTAAALYSFGRTGNGEIPGESKVDRNISGSLYYASGPFAAGLVYDEFQGSSIATQGLKDRRALVGGTYSVGAMKGFVGYRWLNGNAGPLGNVSSNLYWAGLRYMATPALALTGAAYYTDTRNSGADPLMMVASAGYALSKRTDVYLNVAYARNKDGSQLGVNGFNSAAGAANNVMPGQSQTGVVAGVRHRF